MIDLGFEGHRVADCKAKAIRRRGCGHVSSHVDITLSVDMRIHVAGEDTVYGLSSTERQGASQRNTATVLIDHIEIGITST